MFSNAEWFDSRSAPLLFCCYLTVIAGRFAARGEAPELSRQVDEVGWEDVYLKEEF